MAQTGFTPIQLYSSSTPTNTPAAGNLINGTKGSELAVNIADGKLFYKDTSNNVQTIADKTWVGTVTSVSGTSPVAVATGTSTPVVSLSAGYGDTQNPYASKTANNFLAAPNGSAGVPTFRAIVTADIPTLNQNTTGSAATLTTSRNLWGQSFNGSADISAPLYPATGSVSDPAYSVAGDTNTGIFFPAADTIAFTQGGAESMRIDASGNLRLGSTSATGGKQMITFDNAGQSGTRYIHASTTYNGTALVFLRADNSTSMGYIYSDGSSTSYVTTSDYRLKENIQPMVSGLSKVMLLKPCTYKWKDMDKIGEGFIAHELQAVCPDAVYGEKNAVNEDGSIKAQGIDTSFLVATLTAAIQEQQSLIQQLQADVAALKGS
jgi:hypothetical protein